MSHSGPFRIRAVFGRAREVLRSEGIHSLWLKILGETVYRRMDIFERKVASSPADINLPEGFEISFMKTDEVDEFLEFRALHDPDTILGRLAQGQICFLVRAHGKIVHSAWVTAGNTRIDYLACDIELASDVIYVFEAYTSPGFRRNSISSLRKSAMEKYCHDQGYCRLLAVVWPESKPAIENVEKAGYNRVGRVGYIGTGRFRKYFCRYEKNDCSFRLTDKPAKKLLSYGDQYWDGVPENLDSQPHYLDPFLAKVKRQENLRLVRQWGGVTAESRVLKTDAFEEAMGEDTFLADLEGEAGEITAMDVSPAIVGRAEGRHAETALNFVAADVRKLPFRDSSFSIVASPSTLDHFPDPADLSVSLRELFRVMEPGGRLVITLDNRQNVFDPLLKLVHKFGLVPFFLGNSYTVGELCDELVSAGFMVKETTAILHNPRLVAVGTMRFAKWLDWSWFTQSVQNLFQAAQKLENTRLCYFTGSFVAALAIRPLLEGEEENRA